MIKLSPNEKLETLDQAHFDLIRQLTLTVQKTLDDSAQSLRYTTDDPAASANSYVGACLQIEQNLAAMRDLVNSIKFVHRTRHLQ